LFQPLVIILNFNQNEKNTTLFRDFNGHFLQQL
jgi:hypothetical protein